MTFAKVLVTLGLLCIASQAVEIQTFSKEYFSHPADYAFVPRKIAMADQSFVHMSCEMIHESQEFDCQVTLEMADGTQKQCQHVKLAETDYHRINLFDYGKLNMLAGNRVLFEWFSWNRSIRSEQHNKKVSLIDLDSCNVRHLNFPLDEVQSPDLEVLVYHDSFDVYVKSRALCGESHNSQCVLRHNSEGERVGEPVGFPLKYAPTHSTVVDSLDPKSGSFFAAVERNANGSGLMHASHVSHDGSETDLFSYFSMDESKVEHIVGSNEYRYFSTCHLDRENTLEVRCMQYDLEGSRMLMDARVELEGHKSTHHRLLNVFNRREGGVLLVSLVYEDDTKAQVKLVDRNGRVDRQVELTGDEFQCLPSKSITIDHLETEDQHCFYFACPSLQVNFNVEPFKRVASFKYYNKCVDKKTAGTRV